MSLGSTSSPRITILSSGMGWHVRDLIRAGSELDIEVTAHDFRLTSSTCGQTPAGPWTELEATNSIIVRTMPPGSLEQVIFRMNALHRLERLGVSFLNSPRSLEVCVDKYLATVLLERAGLPVPRTIVCQDSDTAMSAFAALGNDVVVKPLFGSEGRGILRVTDPALALRTFRTLERLDSVLYLQEFVDHPGYDLRAFVLGGRIIASMRRSASTGWITNVAQGGKAEPVTLTHRETELALRAADAVGIDAAGVDLLPAPRGEPYVLEVNAVPGWRSASRVCDIDIARRLLEHLRGRSRD